MSRKTPTNRNKIVFTTTMAPAVAQELAQTAKATGLHKNALIEQALMLLFAAQKSATNRTKSNATCEEVALV